MYLDTYTMFIIVALYATRIKLNHQDEIEVQTLIFNLMLRNVNVKLPSPPPSGDKM